VGGAGLEALIVAWGDLAAWVGTLEVDSAGDLLADGAVEVGAADRVGLRAAEADEVRGDGDEVGFREAEGGGFEVWEGDAEVGAAGAAVQAGRGIVGHAWRRGSWGGRFERGGARVGGSCKAETWRDSVNRGWSSGCGQP